MGDIREARRLLEARILTGPASASSADRRAAFANDGPAPAPLQALVGKVVKHASGVTDDDIAAARAAGASEDQIFELVVCAAVGAASRQYDTALAALDAAGAGKDARATRDS